MLRNAAQIPFIIRRWGIGGVEYWMDGCSESVSPFWNVLDIDGCNILSKGFPKGKDVYRQIAFFHYSVGPHDLQQIVFANHSPGIFDKDREDLQSFGRQFQGSGATREERRHRIESKLAELQYWLKSHAGTSALLFNTLEHSANP
jgi:hypothetical protein